MPGSLAHRLGRYELLEQIGSGGMGEVYRAHDCDLHRDVAIKILPERFATDATRLARFSQEARTASSLNHPNIVTIHEIGEAGGRPYIVMEYVEGKTLRSLLERGRPLAIRQTLDIGVQLAEGLAKAHAARIVHRDLKPENVMVTKDGFAKILDFGLAKLRGDGEAFGADAGEGISETVTRLSPNTAAGVLLGTAGYMSPEQARGLPADERSDQFALGTILYEMATGHPAFHRESFVQTLSAIIDADPQSIAERNPSFPAPARWVIERCLAKEPADRYASTLDLARELRGIRERIAETGTSGAGLAGLRPARQSRRSRLAIAVAVILGVIFLVPAVRDSLLRRIRPAPLESQVRLAVLLDDDSLPASDRGRLQGLLDYVVIRLAESNRSRASLSVVPASEVREALVRSPGDAKRRVGANFVMSLRVRRAEQALIVSATLEDSIHLRVLGGDQRTFAGDRLSEEDVVDLIGGVLRMQLPADESTAWVSATSDVAEARSLFARGVTETQTPYQSALVALEKYDRERTLQKAIEDFNRAIELDPRYADAYARLGEAYLLLYRLAREPAQIALAEQNATKARELDDTRPSTWITLGMIHGQQGAFEEAQRDFSNAIARGPRSALAYRELARMEQQRRRPDKAEAGYRKAIELDPEDWANYSYLGSFLYSSSRFSEAEQAFLTAARKAPDNARVWANLGVVYSAQHRSNEAEAAFNHAIALYEYGPALSNLGTLKFRAQQYADAARLYERAVKTSPRDFRLWRNLAAAYYWTPGERGRATAPQQRAIAILKEALGIESDNPDLLSALADSYAMLGDGSHARPLIARAVKLAPKDRDVLQLAAGVYETIGDRRDALEYVAAAFRAGADPQDVERGPTFAALVKDPGYAALKSRR